MATFSYTAPTVGGSEDTWGTTLNTNWSNLSTFLGSLDSTELAVLDGITATTDELNILDGDTAATETTLVDADRVVVNDDGTMVQVSLSDLLAYMAAGLTTVPTGAVQAFAMSTAPSGWLACDGSAVSRTTYADLFAAIGVTYGSGDGVNTFNLPDFRGEFLRGWDNGRGVDASRTFGSAQGDALEKHTHMLPTQSGAGSQSGSTGFLDSTNVWSFDKELNQYPAAGYTAVTFDTGVSEAQEGWNGGTFADETRPRNVAVLYCVKT